MNAEHDYARDERMRGASKAMYDALHYARPRIAALADPKRGTDAGAVEALRRIDAALAQADGRAP